MPGKFAISLSLVSVAAIICFNVPAYGQLDTYSDGISPKVRTAVERSTKLHKDKDTRGAENLLRTLLGELEKEKKTSTADMALTVGNLAFLYKDDKQPETAIPYAKSVVALDTKRLGGASIFVAEDLGLLSDCYFATKKYEEAANTYQSALNVALVANESQYCPCIVASVANSDRKKALIMKCYEGIARSNFQPDRSDTADVFFTSTMGTIMKASDVAYRHARARILYKYYQEYLKSTDQTEKLAKLDEDIKKWEQHIQANREWWADGLAHD